MEHVDALGKSSNVQDPVLQTGMNTDLAYSGTDAGHRLPIVRSQTLLHAPRLKARRAASIARKRG
jgi:hypothetical protein